MASLSSAVHPADVFRQQFSGNSGCSTWVASHSCLSCRSTHQNVASGPDRSQQACPVRSHSINMLGLESHGLCPHHPAQLLLQESRHGRNAHERACTGPASHRSSPTDPGNIDLSPRFAALMPMPGKLTPTLEPEATEVCSMAMSSDRQNREQKSIKSDNMRLPRCRHQWHNQEVPSSGASQTWAPIPALALSALIPSRSNTNASNSIR
nr:uncharacterized protein LOC127491086 isoform X1 [Oryctolagus cuniculus]XP_051701993.1 uncharacterized protein LOC127491086 isoform X1 [Oryctolagus cuniculus]